MTDYVVRFSVRQRVEHLAVMLLFLLLALTGFPQKFFEAGWARWVVDGLGGVQRMRWLHRAAGLLLQPVVADLRGRASRPRSTCRYRRGLHHQSHARAAESRDDGRQREHGQR